MRSIFFQDELLNRKSEDSWDVFIWLHIQFIWNDNDFLYYSAKRMSIFE
jgi:hypothetical protein